MPAMRCANGKWKWGEKGRCIFETKEKAEQVGRAIWAQRRKAGLAEADGGGIMPYPNEHSCRLKRPQEGAQYSRTARQFGGKNADVIWMKPRGADTVEMQAVRFPKETWSESAARAVCESLHGSFEPAKPISESDRIFTAGGLRESGIEFGAFSEENLPEGVCAIARDSVLLQAGLNKSRNRLYRPEFIRSHLGFLEGALSHVDHPSFTEARDRPERSIGTLAAVIRNVRYEKWMTPQGGEAEGARGDVHFLTTTAGKEMREAYRNETVRQAAGLSIYWPRGYRAKRERMAEGWIEIPVTLVGEGKFNVDFVTGAGAGGHVGVIREGGVDEMDFEALSIEELAEKRADLVEALTEAAREGYVKAGEQKPDTQKPVLQESEEQKPEPQPDPEVAALKTALAESDRRVEALEKQNRQLEGQRIVDKALAEAKLTPKAEARVRARFAEAECEKAEDFNNLVEAEITGIKELAAELSEAGRVRGLGPEAKVPETFSVRDTIAEAEGLKKPEDKKAS